MITKYNFFQGNVFQLKKQRVFLKYNLVCNYIVFMPNAWKHDIYHYIFGDITEK